MILRRYDETDFKDTACIQPAGKGGESLARSRMFALVVLLLCFLSSSSRWSASSSFQLLVTFISSDVFVSNAWAQAGEETSAAAKKPLTKEEEERREWIAHWCKRAKKDPKCKFYAEKELGRAMREVSKADKAMGMDEYCQRNKDDMECVARRDKLDLEEKRRKEKELLAFCRKNPDAPRCDPDYEDEGGAEQSSSSNSTKKSVR